MTPRLRFVALSALAVVLVGLGGCGDDVGDLRTWMEQQRRQTAPAPVAAASAPRFEPLAYNAAVQADPFDPIRLQPGGDVGPNLVPPDPRRALPALERQPVEAMSMVGTVERAGQRMALLRIEGGLYTVSVGGRIGVHGGVVQQIGEREVRVAEPVRDALGRSATRTRVITLKEAKP